MGISQNCFSPALQDMVLAYCEKYCSVFLIIPPTSTAKSDNVAEPGGLVFYLPKVKCFNKK